MKRSDFYPNTTQVPNVVLDFIMSYLSGAEFKVVMFFIRQIYGFMKTKDSYSYDQISDGITRKDGKICFLGTGLSRASVISAVDHLCEYGILRKKVGAFKQMNEYSLTIFDDDFDQKKLIEYIASPERASLGK